VTTPLGRLTPKRLARIILRAGDSAGDEEAPQQEADVRTHHSGISDQQYYREEYTARVNRVIDHIESHIAEDLSLRELAAVAGFSPFHFHRVFAGLVGETLNQFIQRIRLGKAADQLLNNPKKAITLVALDCGFAGSANFARAFRQAYGMTASEWRRGGYRRYRHPSTAQSKNCIMVRKGGKDAGFLSEYPGLMRQDEAAIPNSSQRERRSAMDATRVQVRVEEMPELQVAYVRHIGPYQGDSKLFGDLFNKLMRWAGPRGLLRFPETTILVVYHDNPEITSEDRLRISACITVPDDTSAEGEVGRMAIASGKCALARFELDQSEYQAAWDYVFGTWLPESGYQPDDRPCFELYHNDPKDHPEGKSIVDICVPVKPL
jgi:AraC family transcriptional regulator